MLNFSLKHSCHWIVRDFTGELWQNAADQQPFLFFFCRKSTRRRSRSSTAWHRTFPRTLSQDTSSSTSPETDPASAKSPTDCQSAEGEVLLPATGSAQYAHITQALFPVGGALHWSATRMGRDVFGSRASLLDSTVQILWAHTAKSTLTKKMAKSEHSLCTGASAGKTKRCQSKRLTSPRANKLQAVWDDAELRWGAEATSDSNRRRRRGSCQCPRSLL